MNKNSMKTVHTKVDLQPFQRERIVHILTLIYLSHNQMNFLVMREQNRITWVCYRYVPRTERFFSVAFVESARTKCSNILRAVVYSLHTCAVWNKIDFACIA